VFDKIVIFTMSSSDHTCGCFMSIGRNHISLGLYKYLTIKLCYVAPEEHGSISFILKIGFISEVFYNFD